MKQRARKRILITGVNGFLGKALWRYLHKKEKNFEIFGLAPQIHFSSGRVLHGDLNYPGEIKLALRKVYPDCILHFAGGRSSNEKEEVRLNCGLTKNLFEAIKAIPNFSPRIVVPGSAAEYGVIPKGRRIIRETDQLKPISSYGKAKRRQIQMVLEYAQQGFDVVAARIFNILGRGTPTTLSIGQFACQIAMIERGEKQPLLQTASLAGGRDFLDIEDVCAAIICLMKYGKSGEVYNVCSGKKVAMRELLRRLIALARVKDIAIEENKKEHSFAFDVVGSNRKIKSLKVWQPKMSLGQSLKNTLETYRYNENLNSP